MEKIGEVLDIEKNNIYDIFEKCNALVNLQKIVAEEDIHYKEITRKLEASRAEEEAWWKNKASQSNWPLKEGMSWIIDFTTNEIFLV